MKKIIFVILAIFCTLSLSGQTLDYHLQKPQKLYIGTPFHVLVDITASLQDSIFAPQIDTLDIFILQKMTATDKVEKDQITTSIDLIFQPFDTGEFTFPELEFAVKSADSISFLKTKSFLLNIESIIADSTQTIADIAAPLTVGLGFWDFAIPLFILAVIIAGIVFLVRQLKRRQKMESAPIIVDDRPPYQIVLAALQNLKQEKLLEKGDFLQFHFRLSLLLRLFIELQFKVNAVEMTSSEIRNNLLLDDFREKSQIMDFLSFADMIKFAKFVPKPAESESALNWLEGYLRSYENKTVSADGNNKTPHQDEIGENENA